jgi:hypothetical protein
MPITDNRTHLIDGENNNNVSGDTTAAPTGASSVTGTVIEGTNSIEFQVDDAQEALWFDQDTGEATFNIDLSDSTVYVMVKFGTPETRLGDGVDQLGGCICLKDAADGAGGDGIGYTVMGADVPGFPYEFGFFGAKLDVSVVAASPGTNGTDYYQYFGTEAGLAHNAVLQVGFGSFSLVKAVSTSPNAWFDGFYYIANDSYAATIDGGTSGTPETMVDIAGDDVTSGMGMINNPKGSEYGFFAPTEWGTPSGTADSYFTATNEQWYWIGDNAGGHAVGTGHFPFRLIGNATGTNSFVATNVVIVNTGTASAFDCSDTNMDIVEFSGCLFDGLASFSAPEAGTSDFVTDCTFVNCGQVTGNECDFDGTSFLTPTVAADGAAVSWDETISTAHTISELDNTTFSMGSNNHHAVSFSTNVSNGADITLTGIAFNGFDADGTGDSDNSILEFLATTGTITVSLIGCTVDGANASSSNFTVDTRAGCTVNVSFDPKTTKITCEDQSGTALENVRVFLETADNGGGSGLPYEDTVSIVQTAGTATVTHTSHGLATNDYVVIRGATEEGYNKQAQITVTGVSTYTYSVDSGTSSPATGSPVSSYAPISGLTSTLGVIQSSKTWPASQSLKGWARKSTSSPYYKQSPINIADASGGTDLLVLMISDE